MHVDLLLHSRWCNAHGMQVSKCHKVVWPRVVHGSQDAWLHGQRGLDLGLELSSLACLLDGVVHEAGSL